MGIRIAGYALLSALVAVQAWAHSPRWPVSPAVANTCGLQADQTSSFMVPALTLPISVWIDPAFNSSQVALIRQAIAEWNRYAERKHGRTLFTVDPVRRVDPQALKRWRNAAVYCRSPDTTEATGLTILRESSSSHWIHTLGLNDSVPAITFRCTYGDGKGTQAKQWILVQTELPKSQAPFKVWMVHELGHAVGLDHTCDSASSAAKASAGWRSCEGLKKDHPYRQAVLYPYSPTVDQPFDIDLKERLGVNDQLRLSCLLRSLERIRF